MFQLRVIDATPLGQVEGSDPSLSSGHGDSLGVPYGERQGVFVALRTGCQFAGASAGARFKAPGSRRFPSLPSARPHTLLGQVSRAPVLSSFQSRR